MGLCKNFKIMETKPKVQNPNGPSPTLLDLSKNFKNIVSEPNPNPNPNPKPKSPNPILKRGVKIHQKVTKGVRAHETGPAQIQSHLLLGLSKNFTNPSSIQTLNPKHLIIFSKEVVWLRGSPWASPNQVQSHSH